MKYLVVGIVLVGSIGQASICKPCNQAMYDRIYKRIVLDTAKGPLTKQIFDIRNNTIENLRALCNGQKSSWEQPTTVEDFDDNDEVAPVKYRKVR